jgi:hypothetical protein
MTLLPAQQDTTNRKIQEEHHNKGIKVTTKNKLEIVQNGGLTTYIRRQH